MDSLKCTTLESVTTVSVSLEIGLGSFHTPQQLQEWLLSSGVKDEIVQAIPEHTLVALCHFKVPAKLQLRMIEGPTPVTYVGVELPLSTRTAIGESPSRTSIGGPQPPTDVHRFRL